MKALSQKRVWQVEGTSGAGKKTQTREPAEPQSGESWHVGPLLSPFCLWAGAEENKGHKLHSYCNSPSSGGLVQEGSSEVGKK